MNDPMEPSYELVNNNYQLQNNEADSRNHICLR